MSVILTLKGHISTLSIDFVPPLQLDPDFQYGLALLSFHSYNSVPNIDSDSKFYLSDGKKIIKTINIPEGSYEIEDIEAYLQPKVNLAANQIQGELSLKPNNNTIKCELLSNTFFIDFRPKDSIGRILGFSGKLLAPKRVHSSDLPVNIIKVRTIHIDSNITSGAYYNNQPSHTIYEFAVGVDPGFAIDETPQHLIYLPIINRQEIHNISLRILDQDSQLVNFRGEEIIIRLELKQL